MTNRLLGVSITQELHQAFKQVAEHEGKSRIILDFIQNYVNSKALTNGTTTTEVQTATESN